MDVGKFFLSILIYFLPLTDHAGQQVKNCFWVIRAVKSVVSLLSPILHQIHTSTKHFHCK